MPPTQVEQESLSTLTDKEPEAVQSSAIRFTVTRFHDWNSSSFLTLYLRRGIPLCML